MTDKACEPITSRVIRLNRLIWGNLKNNTLDFHVVSRDGLLDALFALYGECDTSHMKKDPNIVIFLEKFQSIMTKLQDLRVNISDFEVKKIIGRGNFGEVQVVREKATGDVYAMKVLHKAETLAHQCVTFYEEERDIMAKSDSPWITKLQYAFQDAHNLYLIMEFHPGGDMLSLLEKCNVLSEETAQFYLAELVLAIRSVHMMGYAHRDIKPDNILIDVTGHIKLADFGSSSKLNSSALVTSKMPVGTPDYIAPEVLISINDGPNADSGGYGVECDWWSLGIVAYEMLFGVTPFANEKLLVVYNNIMNFKESLKFPEEAENISKPVLDLIKCLLIDHKVRLRYEQLVDHPLFSDIDWNNIRQIVPPFVPVVSGQDDTSNFDEFEHVVQPHISDLGRKSEFSGKNLPFIGFTYTTPHESLMERLSSFDSSINSPPHFSLEDAGSKKKDIKELQKTINELRVSEENLKAENLKLTNTVKKQEKKIEKCDDELCRLEDEICSLQSNKKELKRLLQIEREDRVLTEKKANQILRCMKRKKKSHFTPNFLEEYGDREEDHLSPISERLDEAIADFEEHDDDQGSFVRLKERAKSLSPRYARSDTRLLQQSSMKSGDLDRKINDLTDKLRKAKEQNEKLLAAIKTFNNESSTLEQELSQVTSERDEALSKVEDLKKYVIKLELQIFDSQHEGMSSESLSNSRMFDMVGSLQKDVDAKNATVFELKSQLLHSREKCYELEQDMKAQKEKFDGVSVLKDQLEEKLKDKFENELARGLQIADLKQTIASLRKELTRTKKEFDIFNSAEKYPSIEHTRNEDVLSFETIGVSGRVAELESELATYKRNSLTPRKFASKNSRKKLNIEGDEICTSDGDTSDDIGVHSLHVGDYRTDNEQKSGKNENFENIRLKKRITELESQVKLYENQLKSYEKRLESFESFESVDSHKKSKLVVNGSGSIVDTNGEISEELSFHSLDASDIKVEKEQRSEEMRILSEINNQLKLKIAELEKKITSLTGSAKTDDSKCNFSKQLQEKDDMLRNLNIDLRCANREKQKAEDLLAIFRDSNRSLKTKLADSEKLNVEKEKLESEMRDKIEILEKEVSWKKRDIDEKIKMYEIEIEKARLEERIKVMQEMCETQKDINKVFVKTQDQIQEITKEKEKLQTNYTVTENKKSQMSSELETVKQELVSRQQYCNKLEKIVETLKAACSDLEDQLQEFEILLKTREEEFVHVANESSKMKQRIISLESELKISLSEHSEEQANRQELMKQIEELEEDLENQQSIHEAEIQSLQDFLNHQKTVITDLEEQIAQMEQQCSTFDHSVNTYGRKNASLHEELIQLKEETAKYITHISSLKSSNFNLTQELNQTIENYKEAETIIDQLTNDLESSNATFTHERVKLHETVSQQAKLIDFLQAKAESMEKRKKTLNIPRLFGKKETTITVPPSQTSIAEGLEKERTRCRRLQDQLSQARAENMTLRGQLFNTLPKTPITDRSKSSIPVSPMTRAVHIALTASPTTNSELDSPLLISRDRGSKIVKMQGMTHRIPHIFNDIICTRSTKCVACLDSIHFGRRIVKCQECSAICHTKCAWSLPKTCGLPSGFVQHFESAVNKNPSLQVTTAEQTDSEPKGWVKVLKANKQSWDRKFLRIVGSSLFFFANEEETDLGMAVDEMEFSVTDGEIILISAISAAELTSSAKSDLSFVLKIEFRPFTTCWPPRSLYIMTKDFSDKQMWVMALESLIEKYKTEQMEKLENKLTSFPLLKLKGDKCLDILCTFVLEDDILLLGAAEGLFVVSLTNQSTGVLKYKIEGIDSVYQIACINSIGIVVLISGPQRNLSIIKSEALRSWIYDGSLPPIEMDLILDATGCHLFAVTEKDCGDSPFLCSATEHTVTLHRWDSSFSMFCKKKIAKTQEPCSCIHFTKNTVILGCDKFFEMDLKTYDVEEFLDRTDSSLAGLVYGVTQLQSFPISIFCVSCDNEPEEYLVCFHELGVFVDGFGQRTRSDDMKWSRLPLAFAYRSPYLFMTHFNSVEVIELLPRGKSENVRGVLKVPNPQYLGPAAVSGAIYVSTSQDQTVEVLCIDGDSIKSKMNFSSDISETSSSRTDDTSSSRTEDRSSICRIPSPTSKDSEGDDLEFSLSNSLLQSLDSTGDMLSVSSNGDTN